MTTDAPRRNSDDFCYRHPDRQSFVLCQRCLRTICTECQTPAPVGVICPECLRNQQAGRSPAQRKAERRWSRPRVLSPATGRPIVTQVIVAVTTLFWLVGLIPGFGSAVQDWLLFWAPYLYPDLTGTFQPWRLLTVALVHAGFWHVGLNMLALWMIGRILEPMLGRWRFLTLYLMSAFGGSVAVTLLAFTTPVVGASGAIFGLFGALLVIGRHIGADITGIAIILGLNLVIGFIPGFNVSWQAHVGGLVAGALVGLIFARTRSVRRRGLQIGLLAGLGAVLIALLLVPPVFIF
ncbi:rhomboid family intramembrane serine protease [Microbacterium thalassium]|uniref:Membrane associated rhomboid family serine protease n=1 Tax=Microbacterium thalassium TaxID=362649 RepID=A0A7X0KTM8_9MICO|nr:rhomboid family intramembrane serine protease [Microbacterium thalassium]MBB6390286.1 membrane associated rhomboid family serine protease [Microbacterium thalassium]GLK25395.1 rhomboid family intramembrane serine protease [Microbacterium thalassium]